MTSALQMLTAVLIAQSAPISNLHDLGPALSRCFKATDTSPGSQMTVRFSLTREGAILGKPAITYSKLVGSPENQRAFVSAVLGALSSCTPVALSTSFGNAIAGRPITLRFLGGGPGTQI